MKKRGSATNEIYFLLFEFLLVISIGYLLYSYSNTITSDTSLQRILLSRDVALTRNTMLSLPSTSYYSYSLPSSNSLSYVFDKSNSSILENEDFPIKYISFFNPMLEYDLPSSALTSLDNIYFSYQNNHFYLSKEDSGFSQNKGFICPSAPQFNGRKILIVPGHFITTTNPDPRILSENIALGIETFLNFEEVVVINVGAISDVPTIKQEIENNILPDVTLSFSFNQDGNPNQFTVYYPISNENNIFKSKLACLICNELSHSFDYPCLVKPIDPQIFPKKDIKSILSLDQGLMMFVEMGDLNQNSQFLSEPALISNAFKTSLEVFYE